MKTIGIINGPNLNLTGKREQEIYGSGTFETLIGELGGLDPDVSVLYFQSNVEGEIINCLQEWGTQCDGIILNAGAYTHTSVAIGDAVRAIPCRVVEVHLSNILGREEYRHVSYIAPVAAGLIAGMGMDSYRLAFRYLLDLSP